MSSDGGVVFSSTAGYVLQNEKVSPPAYNVRRSAGGAPGGNSITPQRDHCAGTGNWYARPPKSKKHKKAKGGFHLRREADMDEDEEFL